MNMNLGMPFREIHVLLVEHESRDHDSIMNLLHDFSYKVTSVELASTALSIISKGKDELDLAMVNMNSPDLLVAQLLREATKIQLPLILMSNVEIDKQRALMGLEQGAYLCMQKPITMSMLGYLWQIVVREKDLPQKASAKLMVAEKENNNLYVLESDGQINFEQKCKSLGNAKSRGHAHKRKSDWVEWTVELHHKFMAAAKQLGQGKCYPNDILEIMDVPGLTRMQVASHLQKCRSAKWLPPNKRKAKAKAGDDYKEPKSNKVRANKLRFGLMPNFDEDEEEADDDGDASSSSSGSRSSRSRLDHQSLDIKQSSNDDQYFRELLPITDISMLDDHGFHQDFSCPSILTTPDYDEYEVGVGLMADHWS